MRKTIAWIGLLALAGLGSAGLLRAENKFMDVNDPERKLAALRQAIAREGLCWEAGETSMSVLSVEERSRRLGARLLPLPETQGADEGDLAAAALPGTLDWRSHGGNWVTGVRDQESCGSCWAFATVGVLESLLKIVKHVPGEVDLSEQTVLSCSGAGDCDGGYMGQASEFLRKTGAPREDCFPYSAKDESCRPCGGWMSKTVRITSFREYGNPSAATLENALQAAPIAAYMEVYSDFYNYRSGVYERTASSRYEGGHGIVIVGYNDAERYWICKNSWGPTWGDNGFFRIRWGNCKIASYAVSMSGPRVENTAPALAALPAQVVDEGQQLSFTLQGSDADLDSLAYGGSGLPDGAVVDPETGVFTWTPGYTQSGNYSVTLSVSDGIDTTQRTVAVTVTNVKTKKW
jgi:hypothetical protein